MKPQKMAQIICTLIIVFSCLFLPFEILAAEKRIVKIGFIDPLTGPMAAIGIGARNSVDLAVKQANRRPDAPYRYELIAMDDASDPATGVSAATKLCTIDKVVGAITHYNSPVGLATIHVFHRHGIPQIFPSAIAPDITDKYCFPEVHRICAHTMVEHMHLVKFLVEKQGYKTFGCIYETTAYGTSCMKGLKDAFAKIGGEILTEDGIPKPTQDFRPILSRIKAIKPAPPEVIYMGASPPEVQLVKLQMKEMGMIDFVYAGVTGFDSEVFNKITGKAGEGTVIVGKLGIAQDSPFVKAYKAEKYKDSFEATGPYAYDAVNLLISAIEKVGPDDKKLLAKTIRDIEYQGILGLTKFNECGQTVTGGLTMKVSQDEKWVPWDESEYASGKRKIPRRK